MPWENERLKSWFRQVPFGVEQDIRQNRNQPQKMLLPQAFIPASSAKTVSWILGRVGEGRFFQNFLTPMEKILTRSAFDNV